MVEMPATAEAMDPPAAARSGGLFSYESALVLMLGASFGFAFFDRQAINYLTPFIVPELHLSNTQVGALTSGLSFAWAVAAYVIGAWSDRTGVRKPFLLVAILVFSLCSVGSGLATSFLLLLLARGVMGAVEGPFLPICLAIMSVESSPRRRGLNAGIMQNVFSSSFGFFAPVALVWLATHYSWRVAFFLCGLPGLLLFAAVARWVREPRRAAAGPVAASAGAPALSLWQLVKVRNIWLCCLISCCMIGNTIQVASFLPLYFVELRHVSPAAMGGLMSVLGLGTGVGGPLATALSDRLGRKPVMIGCGLLGLVGPLAALYFDGPLLVLGGLLFLGWLSSGAFPLFMGTIPGETISRRYAATCMGLVVCVGELVGGFITPTLGGWAADLTSLRAPLIIAGGFALGAAVAALFLKETAPAAGGRRP